MLSPCPGLPWFLLPKNKQARSNLSWSGSLQLSLYFNAVQHGLVSQCLTLWHSAEMLLTLQHLDCGSHGVVQGMPWPWAARNWKESKERARCSSTSRPFPDYFFAGGGNSLLCCSGSPSTAAPKVRRPPCPQASIQRLR